MPAASSSIVRTSVLRYLALSCLVLLVVGVVVSYVVSRLAVHEEVHQSQVLTTAMADKLVGPLMTEDARAGDREAVARLESDLRTRMRDGSVTHAVVYDENGLVLWSDIDAIRGRRVELASDVRDLFGTRNVLMEEPGERTHPWSQPGDDKLIEIYAGAQGADGQPFVFEAYLPPDFIEADRNLLFWGVLPVVVGAMLLFLLATLPLAVGLARRVDRAAAARSALIDRSLGALQDERRRIARVLHDGVIQDLSAAGYALAAIEQQGSLDGELLNGADTATPDRVLSVHRLVPLLKDDVQQLRTVVGDLLETEVDGNTLQAALRGIQTRARVRFGLEMTLDIDPVVDTLPEPVAAAVFAVVREGLTNAGVHGRASRVDVVVRRLEPAGTTDVAMADQGHRSYGNFLIVTVTDDGAGLPGANGTASPTPSSGVPSGVAEDPREHFGLRLLTRQLQNIQGTVSLTRAPGGGAVLTAMLPLTVAEV